MGKNTLPGSIFTAQAGRLLKKADQIICQVAEDGIYITDSHIMFRMCAAEYDYFIRPVTGHDPGSWSLHKKEKRPSTMDLRKIMHHNADMYPVQVAPILYPCGNNYVQALKAADFMVYVNAAFLEALTPDATIKASAPTAAAIACNHNGEPAAVLMPVRITDEKIKRSAAAYFEEAKPDENAEKQAAKIARLENELKERYAQIDRLEAENQELEKELESLKAKAPEKPQEQKKSPQDIAAALNKYGKTTIKGEKTASPIIWIVADKDKAAALKKAGARWSAKRAAWYVTA